MRLNGEEDEGVLSPPFPPFPPSLSMDRIDTDRLCLWLGGGPFRGVDGGGKLWALPNGALSDDDVR